MAAVTRQVAGGEYMADWPTIERDYSRFLLTSGRTEQTRRTYASGLSLYWRWCHHAETDPVTADIAAVRAWINHRIKTVSSSRAHSSLAALKCFYAAGCRVRKLTGRVPSWSSPVRRQ